jgi:peroxiredoxin
VIAALRPTGAVIQARKRASRSAADSAVETAMNYLALAALSLTWLAIGVGLWFGGQLLRQNGRILLRLDALERRVEESGTGELDVGETRSSPRSRLQRDGLKAGTAAPHFRLPRVDGGQLSLEEYRGRSLLLIFSDPQCGPCNELAPRLQRFHRRNPAMGLVMISRRDVEANRAKIREHGLTFPVVLQNHWEISLLYGIFATPVGYLVHETGITLGDVAVGTEAILELLVRAGKGKPESVPKAARSATARLGGCFRFFQNRTS